MNSVLVKTKTKNEYESKLKRYMSPEEKKNLAMANLALQRKNYLPEQHDFKFLQDYIYRPTFNNAYYMGIVGLE